MNLRSTGRIAVIALLLGVAAYIGLLFLFVEPTPWRDVPEEGMSRNGVTFDEAIAELRIYRLPARGYPFFFEDEVASVQPVLRVAEAATIERFLELLQPPQSGEPSWCIPAKPESGLHVLTYRADGSIFGYVVVYEAKLAQNAPEAAEECSAVVADGVGGFTTWYVEGFRAELRSLGVPGGGA